jgi:hypothetical protein
MKIAAISLALAIGLALASSALAADPVDPNFKAFQVGSRALVTCSNLRPADAKQLSRRRSTTSTT